MTIGRVAQETGKVPNPFMVTSNQSYGMSLTSLAAYNGEYLTAEPKKSIPKDDEYDLSFLYSRESDRIGEGINLSDSSMAKVLSTKEPPSCFAKNRRNSVFVQPEAIENSATGSTTASMPESSKKDHIEKSLNDYKHNPKEQNPLFITTSNSYGKHKPAAATYTSVERPRGQSFSNSFNRMMFRDQGLNTSLARSNVHSQLDP
mmetsp:Transcript_22578/g.33257  ORF Transcript_22578/g.33257 Transcript_22578/m.33257 type:complete len:203 (+) Transcript_22578:786-1394(+)